MKCTISIREPKCLSPETIKALDEEYAERFGGMDFDKVFNPEPVVLAAEGELQCFDYSEGNNIEYILEYFRGIPEDPDWQHIPSESKTSTYKHGARELSDTSMNSMIGCANNCLYCYAAHSAVEKEYIRSRAAWSTERVRKTLPDFNRKYPGRLMYPTSHDITHKNMSTHVKAVGSLLTAGNELLICSKARWGCLHELAQVCAGFKDKVIFMITITTLDEAQSIFWEPNAPSPAERILTLQTLHGEGFRTSVLVEPLLQGPGSAMDIYNRVFDHVSEEIWFGTMNYVDTRVDMSVPENVKAADALKRYHSKENMRFLYESMKDLPKVRFKRSIAVLGDKR